MLAKVHPAVQAARPACRLTACATSAKRSGYL